MPLDHDKIKNYQIELQNKAASDVDLLILLHESLYLGNQERAVACVQAGAMLDKRLLLVCESAYKSLSLDSCYEEYQDNFLCDINGEVYFGFKPGLTFAF